TMAISSILLLATSPSIGAFDKPWLEQWQKKTQTWRALHLLGPQPGRLDVTRQLISEFLVPMGFNTLILEVNYGFQYQSHPELNCRGLTRQQARDLTTFCRK